MAPRLKPPICIFQNWPEFKRFQPFPKRGLKLEALRGMLSGETKGTVRWNFAFWIARLARSQAS